MADTHHLVKTILIPQIAELLMKNKNLTENEALRKIYNSPLAELLEDDSMGLYGQSALYLYGLIENQNFAQSQLFRLVLLQQLMRTKKAQAKLILSGGMGKFYEKQNNIQYFFYDCGGGFCAEQSKDSFQRA